jgi:hypothetical protein
MSETSASNTYRYDSEGDMFVTSPTYSFYLHRNAAYTMFHPFGRVSQSQRSPPNLNCR